MGVEEEGGADGGGGDVFEKKRRETGRWIDELWFRGPVGSKRRERERARTSIGSIELFLLQQLPFRSLREALAIWTESALKASSKKLDDRIGWSAVETQRQGVCQSA
jgi:hypothetical protein